MAAAAAAARWLTPRWPALGWRAGLGQRRWPGTLQLGSERCAAAAASPGTSSSAAPLRPPSEAEAEDPCVGPFGLGAKPAHRTSRREKFRPRPPRKAQASRGWDFADDSEPAAHARPNSAKRRATRARAEYPGFREYQPAQLPGTPASPSTTKVEAPFGLADDDFDFVFLDVVPETPGGGGGGAPAALGDAAGGAAALLQAKLTAARSSGHVMEVVSDNFDDMDTLHAVTALHRLARFRSRGEAAVFAKDPARLALLKKLGGALDQLSTLSLCCVLWALARLAMAPAWLERLLELNAEAAPSFSAHQLSTALYSLARLHKLPAAQRSQSLMEALHQEVRRRQQSFGPGATSAMDTVLIADSLARLQIYDDALFASLAGALRSHLEAGELQMREVRHAATAFASIGFVDARLSAAICDWLRPRVAECSAGDLVALAFALARAGAAGPAHGRLFAALAPEVLSRTDRRDLSSRDASSLLYSFSQAGALSRQLASALAEAVERAPNVLDGQDLALMVPCLGAAASERPELMGRLASRTARLAGTLSPRQLARLACGFGDAHARSPLLWEALGRESLARSASFSAPDVLRVLAGLDAAGFAEQEVLRTFWSLASTKIQKYLAEESLAFLRLWPRLEAPLKRELEALPGELIRNLRQRLERGSRSGWHAPVELGVELFEWLPQSRALQAKSGTFDGRLIHAAFGHLPHQVLAAKAVLFGRLLAAMALADPELSACARAKLQQQKSLRDAVHERLARDAAAAASLQATPRDPGLAVAAAFRCASLGFDGEPMRELLRALLGLCLDGEPRAVEAATFAARAAQLCWACAEVRAHRREATRLTARFAERLEEEAKEGEEGLEGVDAVSGVRLAWASLACGSADSEVHSLLQLLREVDAEDLLPRLTPVDLQPARQLAWHAKRQAPAVAGRWAEELLERGPGPAPAGPAARQRSGSSGAPSGASTGRTSQPPLPPEQQVSGLLQQMRVPHVVASPAAVPGGIYRVSIWFPQPRAVLDVDSGVDRLTSGALGGAAELRRRQLRAAGLQVHAFDSLTLRGPSRAEQLRVVAEAVAPSCPEASAWLAGPEGAAAQATEAMERTT